MANRNHFTDLLRFLLVIITVLSTKGAQPEMKLVSVIFRHGDRAPDNNGYEMYPNDPYLNCSFYPMGLGGLTNEGKRREYKLGEILRLRYGKFLGSVYEPWAIQARSTDYDRTKMSLQLVLSALYPPDAIQKWHSEMPWQPIPTIYKPSHRDILLIPEECPKYLDEYNRIKDTSEVQAKIKKFSRLMEFIEKNTGKQIKDANDLYYLYHTFMAETSMGLTLPGWAENIFPHGELLKGINLEYDIISYNTLLKRLNGGMLVRKLSEDMQDVRNGTIQEGRKMFLYSGHETNVAALQKSLGVYEPHVPAYSSAVIVELLKIKNESFVKVLYYLGIPPKIVVQKIPGCTELCPLDKFLQLMKDVTPSDEDLKCFKKKTTPAQGILNNLVQIFKTRIWNQ